MPGKYFWHQLREMTVINYFCQKSERLTKTKQQSTPDDTTQTLTDRLRPDEGNKTEIGNFDPVTDTPTHHEAKRELKDEDAAEKIGQQAHVGTGSAEPKSGGANRDGLIVQHTKSTSGTLILPGLSS